MISNDWLKGSYAICPQVVPWKDFELSRMLDNMIEETPLTKVFPWLSYIP